MQILFLSVLQIVSKSYFVLDFQCQTAYVPGRNMRESVGRTSDLLEYTDIHNLPDFFLIIDIEKAFDSVDHIFLCSSLKKFGFGTEFTHLITHTLNKQESCFLNDGILLVSSPYPQ